MYYQGIGVEEDLVKSFEWNTKAAKQDHPLAQYRLAFHYKLGEGTKQDSLKAFEWFKGIRAGPC